MKLAEITQEEWDEVREDLRMSKRELAEIKSALIGDRMNINNRGLIEEVRDLIELKEKVKEIHAMVKGNDKEKVSMKDHGFWSLIFMVIKTKLGG